MRCSDKAPKSHIRVFYLQNIREAKISKESSETSEVPLILQSLNAETGSGFLWMAPAVCQRPRAEHLTYQRNGSMRQRTSEFSFIFTVISVDVNRHCSGLLYFISLIFTCQKTSAKERICGIPEISSSRIKSFLWTWKCWDFVVLFGFGFCLCLFDF